MGADFWCWDMSVWFEGPGCCDISVIFLWVWRNGNGRAGAGWYMGGWLYGCGVGSWVLDLVEGLVLIVGRA